MKSGMKGYCNFITSYIITPKTVDTQNKQTNE